MHPVKIPNGMNVPVKGSGNAVLNNGMKLNNILHIPDFQCNLPSVSTLMRDYNCAIIFVDDFCIMQDLHSRNLIGLGKHQDGLYILEPTQDKKIALKVGKTSEDKLWHSRLGHTSVDKIKTIGFDVFKNQDSFPCDSCIRAKQTRLPFPVSTIKTVSCFDLIHCDIWGRYNTSSTSGAHYFLSIVDDYSMSVWVYLMKHKSEVERYLPMFIYMIETQFGKHIKRVRTDNGMEFTSNYMQNFYENKGIVMELSCTYTP